MENQENAIVKTNPFKLMQPNAMTNAIVPYSAVGKDVLYFIIDELQKYQRHEKTPRKDLFGDVVITLKVADIAKDNNYKYIWDAIKNELMKKPIEYEFYNEQGKHRHAATIIVPHMERSDNYAVITFRLPPLCYALLLELWRGFTAFDKVVALSLPSKYSKKLYEKCCQWRSTGIYVETIEKFRKIMCCEKKYKNTRELRVNVIDSSIADINEHSEFEVSYILMEDKAQKGVGRKKINRIMFFIKDKQTPDREYYFENYRSLYNFLAGIYAGDSAMDITDWLMNQKKIVVADKRFSALRRDILKGKIKKIGLHNYLRTILDEEYEVPTELLPAKKESKGKVSKNTLNNQQTGKDVHNIRELAGQILARYQKNNNLDEEYE